ncbi:hypothetical protein GOODEAATRI_031381 [Goodea atripinnis]|uniref:Secreted protein n=1 Tax=Goodea atripinnis TaxID=208336 RepID=A0ABV0N5S4_9TELE
MVIMTRQSINCLLFSLCSPVNWPIHPAPVRCPEVDSQIQLRTSPPAQDHYIVLDHDMLIKVSNSCSTQACVSLLARWRVGRVPSWRDPGIRDRRLPAGYDPKGDL